MANPAEDLSQIESLEARIIQLEGEGVLAYSDTHGNPEMSRRAHEKAANDNYILLHGGDKANDYGFGEVMQEAAKRGYKFNTQLEVEYLTERYNEGQVTKSEFWLYSMVKIAQQNGVMPQQVLDHFAQEGKDFEGNSFTQKDKETLEGLLKSEVTQKKFENIFNEMSQDAEVQMHRSQNYALYETFMREEAKREAELMNESGVTELMILGNHESVIYAQLLKQELDDPNQLIILPYEASLAEVKDSNGQSITITGKTNCYAPMGYLGELLPPEIGLETIFPHMYEDMNEGNLLQGKVSREDINAKDYETNWYTLVEEALGERELDILQLHGSLGGEEGSRFPFQADVAKKGLEAKMVLFGHEHTNNGVQKTAFGVDTYGLAGPEGMIIRKDEEGNLVHERYTLTQNYGNGMENAMMYSARTYVDMADAFFNERYNVEKNANDNIEGSDPNAA